jgi:hypothetical protein
MKLLMELFSKKTALQVKLRALLSVREKSASGLPGRALFFSFFLSRC